MHVCAYSCVCMRVCAYALVCMRMVCTCVQACVCVCVFCVAVIKYPDKKQLRGERLYFNSYSQVTVCYCREVTGTGAWGSLASAVKAERNGCVHDKYSASFFCSYTVQAQSLANGAIDFQSWSSLRQPAADMLRGWPGLDDPFWSSLGDSRLGQVDSGNQPAARGGNTCSSLNWSIPDFTEGHRCLSS